MQPFTSLLIINDTSFGVCRLVLKTLVFSQTVSIFIEQWNDIFRKIIRERVIIIGRIFRFRNNLHSLIQFILRPWKREFAVIIFNFPHHRNAS